MVILFNMTQVEDCSFSATSTTSTFEYTVEYDNHPSPFTNVEGNHFVVNNLIGIFTNAEINGFHNNATKLTTYLDEREEEQTWISDYNEFSYSENISWQYEETTQEEIDFTYY